jgi:hypothetical protein
MRICKYFYLTFRLQKSGQIICKENILVCISLEYTSPLLCVTFVNYIFLGAGIAQSVQRRATGWMAGVRFPAEAIFFPFTQRPDEL